MCLKRIPVAARWKMHLRGRMEAGRLLQSCRRDGGGGQRQMGKKGRICIEKHMGGKINPLSVCQMGRVREVFR